MDAELILLRDFYLAWERLHSLTSVKPLQRNKAEDAAQELTDCAHQLRNLYNPAQLNG